MKHPNLARRGHLFWWRRKITLSGIVIAIDLPLCTANFHQARAIAGQLAGALENLRMAYGQRGSAVDPATLKGVFRDAMRWQLERIRQSQLGSIDGAEAHRRTNRLYAELWRHHAAKGADAVWTEDDKTRLLGQGWSPVEVAELLVEANRYGSRLVSLQQLQTYAKQFGFALTPSNQQKVEQVILSARASACEKADQELGPNMADLSGWADEALTAMDPLIFEQQQEGAYTEAVSAATKQDEAPAELMPPIGNPAGARMMAPMLAETGPAPKLLNAAKDECIAAYRKAEAWSADTIEQVNTAIRLFDYACGSEITIEAITKEHVLKFKKLCDDLPNRWGRTREEKVGGIPASLERAKGMDPSMLGMSQETRNKHLTWISSVLAFAAGDDGGNHEPADVARVEKAIRDARSGLGTKGGKSDRQRARDKRKAWTRDEIRHLLSAPIWSGCLSLDERFQPGPELYHDAWYWLPLMFVLYGGRSSELVALPLGDTQEDDAIPHFLIDYTDLRSLKNVQSVRHLPIHPELIRLGFLDYVRAMRAAGHALLFPELHSPDSKSFASTFYKSVFDPWRHWAFPNGTPWRHRVRGAWKDKDVHSFRGAATSLMKGKVPDSIRIDILGHEGETETSRSYDEEATLEDKLTALELLTPLTAHIPAKPLCLRPPERQRFGARQGRRKRIA